MVLNATFNNIAVISVAAQKKIRGTKVSKGCDLCLILFSEITWPNLEPYLIDVLI